MLRVINLYAGPGAGKSTCAAGLFNLMKVRGYSVELVTEVAKDITYDRAYDILTDQLLVFAEQHHRLYRLKEQVEYAITDSPISMGLAYCTKEWASRLWPLMEQCWDDYDNRSFFILRGNKPYRKYGRNQTEAEARTLDSNISDIAARFGTTHYVGGEAPEEAILDHLQGIKRIIGP